eukprot:1744894-Amphidinium_carterae.1
MESFSLVLGEPGNLVPSDSYDPAHFLDNSDQEHKIINLVNFWAVLLFATSTLQQHNTERPCNK